MDASERYAGKTVLAVGAHPDDLETGIGGTLARLSRSGARVVMAVACIPSQWETRLEEARRSAEILGAEFRLLLADGPSRVEDVKTYTLVRLMDELTNTLDPSAVFSHGPSDVHRDHSLVYEACLASQRLKFRDFFCYYPASCHPVPFVPFRPQAFVDISDTIDVKMKAIRAHPSQFQDRGLQTDYYMGVGREQGVRVGVPYAEGFEVVRMVLV